MSELMSKTRVRASTLVWWENRILVVYLEDPTTKLTLAFLPGGKIEHGESPAVTAIRETLEETGIGVVLRSEEAALCARYDYVWDNCRYDCTTYFFIADPREKPTAVSGTVIDASYHRGYAWLEKNDAVAQLCHHAELTKFFQKLVFSSQEV